MNPPKLFVDSGFVMGLYTALDPEAERLLQITDEDKVFNAKVRERFNDLADPIGLDDNGDPNYESVNSDVNVSLISLETAGAYFEDERNSGFVIPIENADTPLARAECIKFIALLFDEIEAGNDMFAEVEKRYNESKTLANNNAVRRPSVFFNYPHPVEDYDPDQNYNDNYEWVQPGQSYLLTLLEDAIADYRFNDNEDSKILNFDEIVNGFRAARFLLNSGRTDVLSSNRTLEEFVTGPVFEDAPEEDQDFENKVAKELVATICGNVWSNQKRIASEATDFNEGAIFKPDEVLTDYIKILHPYIGDIKENTTYLYSFGDSDSNLVGTPCPLTILEGDPPQGKMYVNVEFRSSQTRFEIDDIVFDNKVIETLSETLFTQFGITEKDLELYYPGDKRGVVETVLIVRAAINENDESDYKSSGKESLMSVLRTFGIEVTDDPRPSPSVSPSPSSAIAPSPGPSETPEPSEGGGLSGGGIAGIVIACLIVAGIVTYFVVIRRRRSRQPLATTPNRPDDEMFGDGGGASGTDYGGVTGGGVGGRSSGRWGLGGRGRKMPTVSPGPAAGEQESDPFEI